eukprot:1159420-Pelagomonas_calceolata.AAC.18
MGMKSIQRLATLINIRHALHFQGASGGGGCWTRGGGEQEKESPGVHEHGGRCLGPRHPLLLIDVWSDSSACPVAV